MSAFERAAEVMAKWMPRLLRDEEAEPTENDRLIAGHLAGALWANDLLNLSGECWETLESLVDRITPENRHPES